MRDPPMALSWTVWGIFDQRLWVTFREKKFEFRFQTDEEIFFVFKFCFCFSWRFKVGTMKEQGHLQVALSLAHE